MKDHTDDQSEFNPEEQISKETNQDSKNNSDLDRPEEVVSQDGERAFFSGKTIHFFPVVGAEQAASFDPEGEDQEEDPFSEDQEDQEFFQEEAEDPERDEEDSPSDSEEEIDAESREPQGSFADFFSDPTEDAQSLARVFEAGLHSVFQTEEPTKDQESDSEEGSENDLSDDERYQKEAEEVQQENLDEIIRQNDEDSLFILGEKYDRADSIDASGSMEINPRNLLEAMLFVGDRNNVPLDLKKATALMRNVSIEEARKAIEDLNLRYEKNGAPYRILEEDQGFRMVLCEEYEPIRDRFFGKIREFRLSQKAIDLLALIAYRQPISAAEITSFKPDCRSILNLLLKRDLIEQERKIVDKKQIVYFRTTPRFLKVFQIESLDDLPVVEEIDYR
ncbi:MAG: SMC-Scp complex subunit ScpB [Planctomycetia bacterium]|nr:SMC-Scp complex subunit ScpB [Planctomycetia bacterium]